MVGNKLTGNPFVSQIGKTSSLVLTLAGILKAILLVAFAVVFRGEESSPLQAAGYTVALFGLVYYSLGRDQLRTLSSSIAAKVAGGFDDGRVSPLVRRTAAVAAVLVVVLVVLGIRGGGGAPVETPDAGGAFGWMSKLGWSG